jgi:hypothetical protein
MTGNVFESIRAILFYPECLSGYTMVQRVSEVLTRADCLPLQRAGLQRSSFLSNLYYLN